VSEGGAARRADQGAKLVYTGVAALPAPPAAATDEGADGRAWPRVPLHVVGEFGDRAPVAADSDAQQVGGSQCAARRVSDLHRPTETHPAVVRRVDEDAGGPRAGEGNLQEGAAGLSPDCRHDHWHGCEV